MGKSEVARMFERAGVPVFDADAEVRRLQGPRGDLLAAIESRFPGTTGREGVDRDALSARVLRDPGELKALEAIVHPVIQRKRAEFIDKNRDKAALLFEIPLLFETGGEGAFDKIIVVFAPSDVQRRRVLERPGMTQEKLAAILARQMSDSEKRARANFIVQTGGELSTTEAQVREILSCLGLSGGE